MPKGFRLDENFIQRLRAVLAWFERSHTPTAWKPPRMDPYPSGEGVKYGQLDGDLAKDGSATMSIYAGTPLADTTRDITVWDNLLATGKTLPSGTRVWVRMLSGRWYVFAAGGC